MLLWIDLALRDVITFSSITCPISIRALRATVALKKKWPIFLLFPVRRYSKYKVHHFFEGVNQEYYPISFLKSTGGISYDRSSHSRSSNALLRKASPRSPSVVLLFLSNYPADTYRHDILGHELSLYWRNDLIPPLRKFHHHQSE